MKSLAPTSIKLSCSVLLVGVMLINTCPLFADDTYVEAGSLRISNKLSLEGVFHKVRSGWGVSDSGTKGRDKTFTPGGTNGQDWESEIGENLLTEFSGRFSEAVSARALIELQGDYADRYWRPVNLEHDKKIESEPLFLRQVEGRIDEENWFLHGFSGVSHGNWQDKGDFFGLYREAYGESDYLGSSSFYGIYPDSWRQDLYINVSQRRVPSGFEAGVNAFGVDVGAAYGDELQWGYEKSFFGRASFPVKSTKLSVVVMNEDVPASFYSDDERKKAGSVTWTIPFEAGHLINVGVLYQPFRVDKTYQVARETEAGEGVLGSGWNISEKTAQKSDGFAERVRLEGVAQLGTRFWVGTFDLTHAGILAGNKDEVGLGLGTDITPTIKWQGGFTYRRPLEGPIPFLYEGTPDNIGAIAANPRGADSPFTVGWENREAKILLNTFWFDPTPGTNTFNFEPTSLASWNFNKDEDARLTVAFQHRMSDYPTATDRQFYYNELGDLVWESAGHAGAWATEHPIHEFRVLTHGKFPRWDYTFGFAGGESLAVSGLAYIPNNGKKPITDYYSIEGRIGTEKWNFWGHYGTGVWGPEPHIHPFFGDTFDRLYGGGVRYNFTRFTTWDVSYIAALQNDDQFVSTSLGSYDEIRTIFSHRFGFLLNFKKPLRTGTMVP